MKLYSRTTIILSFLVLMFVMSCEIFNPSPNAYSNKILFTSERSGIKQLYIVDPDGTNIEKITSGIYSHSWGRWSPDANKIVCNTSQWMSMCDYDQFMVIVKPNSLYRNLLSYGDLFEWHPDSNLIIYEYGNSGSWGGYAKSIYTEISRSTIIDNADTSNNQDRTPAYSPDGSLIAFASNRDFINEISPKCELYIMNRDGSEQQRLTYLDTFFTWSPYWSNDMSKIIFNSSGRICSIDLADSTVEVLCESTDGEYVYISPRLSPDNDKIIFIARALDGSTNEYLFMSDIDGSNIHALIPDSTVSSCDWSK